MDNYPLWLTQIVPHLKGGNLYGYVDGSIPCPPLTIPTPSKDVDFASTTTYDAAVSTSPNPAYQIWQMQDQIILGAINSTLSEKLLIHVTRCFTSRQAWVALEKMFNSQSHSRIMQVHLQLSTLKKGSSSISDYYHRFQTLIDILAYVGHPIDELEQQGFLLGGLGPEYDPFVTSVLTRADPLSMEEIYGHLLTHEIRLDHNQSSIDLSIAGANFAARGSHPHRGSRGRNSNSTNFSNGRGSSSNSHKPYRGRGRSTHTPGRGVLHSRSMPVRLVCQVCNKQGHIALDCYNRFNESYSRDSQGQPHAYYSTPSSSQDYNWYPDSGATHHLTSDLNNLNLKSDDYIGPDQIKIGNGTGLPIHHIGHTRLFTPSCHFDLSNILHVPHISKKTYYMFIVSQKILTPSLNFTHITFF